MTLRHLAVFTAVVDADCSVTKAAETLHIAQPAVSQTIADLEAYYGLHLFDRLNHRLYLTPAGEKLLSYSRRLVDNFNQIDGIMKNSEVELPLRIGASFTVSCVLLPKIMKKFSTYSADVTVCNTAELENKILESSLDVAIVEGTISSADILETVLTDDMLVCVATPSYKHTLSEPNKATFILREEGSGTRIQSDAMLAAANYTPHVWSIANTQSIIELVKAGVGATIISRALIKKELSEKKLCEYPLFSTKNSKRTFRLVYHKDKFIDTRMNAFMKLCAIKS